MPGYYLYFFTPDGHIRLRLDLQFPTDVDAIAFAENHEDGSAKELWQQGRLVQQVPARRQQA